MKKFNFQQRIVVFCVIFCHTIIFTSTSTDLEIVAEILEKQQELIVDRYIQLNKYSDNHIASSLSKVCRAFYNNGMENEKSILYEAAKEKLSREFFNYISTYGGSTIPCEITRSTTAILYIATSKVSTGFAEQLRNIIESLEKPWDRFNRTYQKTNNVSLISLITFDTKNTCFVLRQSSNNNHLTYTLPEIPHYERLIKLVIPMFCYTSRFISCSSEHERQYIVDLLNNQINASTCIYAIESNSSTKIFNQSSATLFLDMLKIYLTYTPYKRQHISLIVSGFRNFDNTTALINAIEKNDFQLVQQLILYGIGLNERRIKGSTLEEFRKSGNENNFFEEKIHYFNEYFDRNNRTGLPESDIKLFNKIIEYATENKPSEGLTALHVTVCNRNIEMAEILLKNGAKILPDLQKKTPFHYAEEMSLTNFLELFQKYQRYQC